MTLIVGIRCTNGIVLAGDGAVTLGAFGQHTAQQRTVRKLTLLQGKIIIGLSGPVGLAQRFQACLDEGCRAGRYAGRAELAVGAMRQELWQIVGPEWVAAHAVANVMGAHVALESVLSSALVAAPLNDRAELIEFDQQCAPTLATDDLPFMAVGSARGIADPFLGFVRHVLWPQGCPTVPDGIFSAVWTLEHAIDTNAGGVAAPIQVAVLEQQTDGWKARELADAELRDHRQAVVDAEDALKKWRAAFTTAAAGAAPAPAPPPL